MTQEIPTTRAFTITRAFTARPDSLYRVYAEPALKRRWLYGTEGTVVLSYEPDFRPGGVERAHFHFGGGMIHTEQRFEELIPDRLIRLRRVMWIEGALKLISDRCLRITPITGGAEADYTAEVQMFDPADTLQRNRDTVAWYLVRLNGIATELERGDAAALSG